MSKKLIILGSALRGGALLIVDALKRSTHKEYEPIGILDDTPGCKGQKVLGVDVIGEIKDLERLYHDKVFDEAIIGVGSVKGRDQIFNIVNDIGIKLANIIDDSVMVRSSVELGKGNVIMAGCDFGPMVSLGDNNFFCSHTIIEHESSVGYGCSFSVRCTFAGRVKIGNMVSCAIGSGAKAYTNIPDHTTLAAGMIL